MGNSVAATRTRVALIGLGAMGLPIAQRLAEAGVAELALFDVAAERLSAADGLGRAAGSLADAAAGSDVVLTVLPADRHVEAVAGELARAARAGQLYVDFSTIAPATIETVAARLATVGVTTVSCAIARGTAAARAGELTVYVGAENGVPAVLRPALDALAADVRVVPRLGAAKAVKLANNMVLACIDVAVCEALVLARRLGLAWVDVTAHLAHAAESWALEHHIVRHVLTGDLGPGHFSTRNMAKDVGLYLELAAAQGRPAFLAGVAASCYRGALAAGYGEDYHPIVVEWLARGADGAEPPPAVEREPALDAIGRGVAAVQALASLDALTVVAATGIEPDEAAGHLAAGSAANDGLEAALAGPSGAALAADLEALLELGAAANVPLLTFETASHVARLLGP